MSYILKIITPEKKFFEGEVDSLTIKTTEGYLGILPNHLPLVAMLASGPMYVSIKGMYRKLTVTGGVLNVTREKTIILADAIEFKEEINLEEEQIEVYENKRPDEERRKRDNLDYQLAETALKREITKIKGKNEN